ncbi:hypothetical protein K7432_009116 [Basidiobolus ranarum]|uniref:Uncharacterized protein n=1 Tax=Basidiobolus ranarum TaxID=34480 RepID=A0ABR2WQY1_9FUNG
MKFTYLTAITTLASSIYGAQNYLPVGISDKSCSYADTYNLCVSNILTVQCADDDAKCNCNQAQGFQHCVYYCPDDPDVNSHSSEISAQIEKYCPLVTSTSANSAISASVSAASPSASSAPSATSATSTQTSTESPKPDSSESHSDAASNSHSPSALPSSSTLSGANKAEIIPMLSILSVGLLMLL